MKNKKLFAILTLVCFMFTLMPVAAMADDNVAVDEFGVLFATLADALQNTTGSEITLLKDITISDDWDCRKNGAKILKPITIDGQEHTIKLIGKVDDKNWDTVFRFEDNATVKNLIIDVSEATGVQRGVSAKMNITVENCKFIGNGGSAKRAIIFGEGAGTAINEVTATINGCEFSNWSYGVSDNQSGKDAKSVVITGSTFENASVLVSASETVTFSENELDNGYVNISSYTVPNKLSVTAIGNTLESDYAEYNTIKASTINAQDDFVIKAVAKAEGKYYTDLQEAIKAAAPSGTVEILKDVTVDEWIMMSQTKTIGNGNIITMDMNGLTINGNGHTLTVNNVESAGNGGYLFDDAAELNISNLTINMADGVGGIDLENGTISHVVFNDGNCIFPGVGDITITECKFNTAGYVIYYEAARDNLVVTNNVFNAADDANIILLHGNETFAGNTVNSGRTVNVVSGSPVVTGNNFNDVRLKVYNAATATIENNIINNLVFGDDSEVKSRFSGNTLSAAAEEALKSAGCAFTVTYTDGVESEEIFADQTTTVEKDSATPAFDGTPTRSGYTFAGWEPEVAATVTTNSVYTATWTKNSTSYYYGGGTSASVSIASDDNATVKVSDKYASKGETVTITVDVKDGFYAKDVVVTDKNGEAITVTRVALDKWEFTMTSGKVKVDVDSVEYTKEVVLQIGDLDIAVNDTVIQSDVAPFIKNDRTMVPISVIVYALGGTTDWDGETRTVTVTLDGKVLTMVIDEIIPGFGAAAIIVDSRTYVPIGYVADVLGCDVEWIAAARQVVIVK